MPGKALSNRMHRSRVSPNGYRKFANSLPSDQPLYTRGCVTKSLASKLSPAGGL